MQVDFLGVRAEEHVKLLAFGQVYKRRLECASVSLLENGLAFPHLGGSFRDQTSLGFWHQLLFHVDRGYFRSDVALSDLIR